MALKAKDINSCGPAILNQVMTLLSIARLPSPRRIRFTALTVCLSVCKITEKVMDRFGRNFQVTLQTDKQTIKMN